MKDKEPIETVEQRVERILQPVRDYADIVEIDQAEIELLALIRSEVEREVREAERAGHVHAAKALKHQAELLGGTPEYMLKQFDVHIERHSHDQDKF